MIDKLLLKLLIEDPQRNRNCETSKYDLPHLDDGSVCKIVYLENGKISTSLNHIIDNVNSSNLLLPMSLEKITNQQFIDCVITACRNGRSFFDKSIKYTKILCHPNFVITDKNLKEYNRVNLKNLDLDELYFLPGPEFLGVYTYNLNRYGMFIMSDHICKN